MLRVIDRPARKIELLMPDKNLLEKFQISEAEVRAIARSATTRLLRMKTDLSIYSSEHKIEFVFRKVKIDGNIHSIQLENIISKEILINDGSRIVAMSFCEPRSCIGRLSS